MKENTGAPFRHPLDWQNPDFYDEAKLDEEFRRQADVCHGCRRCFNLCDSFPRLFDLIDESETGELDSVDSKGFADVVDACTLCDMCFMVKCPYVPPHEFNIDFPHLMLRYRAAQAKKQGVGLADRELAKTDRNGKLASKVAPLANWATDTGNGMTRGVMSKVLGVHKDAGLPKYHAKTFSKQARRDPLEVNADAPAHGRKAVLYSTCYGEYNQPETGMAARKVLAHNGVETEVVYPGCCGMPQLEQGDIANVADKARKVAAEMKPWIEKGYKIVALTPSCALMLKLEWPLILPDDPDVRLLADNAADLSEYMVDIARNEGLADGLKPLPGPVSLHFACHSRAQNIGNQAAEMLRAIPDTKVQVIERCSGHGGAWGVKNDHFEVAIKVGRPVARTALKQEAHYVSSECPLAGLHILQGMEKQSDEPLKVSHSPHPIMLLAKAYGLMDAPA